MNKNDEYIVNIEKMIYGGNSLARIDDFPIFINSGCPNDKVKIKITNLNKRFANAEIVEIIEASEHRIKPICALHNVCGSCNWQHIEYNEQLRQKENIVKETIKNITGFDYKIEKIIASPKIKEYRCKVQFPVSQTKVSKRIVAGYYKTSSHELINVKYCHMNKPIINEIMEFIKEKANNFNLSGYNEKSHTGLIRHLVIRQSSDEKNILIIFVINSNNINSSLKSFAKVIIEKYPCIKGICANINTGKTNVILGNKTEALCGDNYYIDTLSNKKYKISAQSFFQINPYCAELIFNKVKELISNNIENPTILDAYSGVSSFGIWLSDIAKKVTCIEEVVSASNDAKDNIILNNIDNLEIINGDASLEFDKLIKRGTKFDVSIVDPPRKGCTKESIDNLVKLSKDFIIYVSCNISTLARDMNLLAEYNYYPTYIQPADMFPNTYHIETIALFKRKEKH